jgi:hypothetical protein
MTNKADSKRTGARKAGTPRTKPEKEKELALTNKDVEDLGNDQPPAADEAQRQSDLGDAHVAEQEGKLAHSHGHGLQVQIHEHGDIEAGHEHGRGLLACEYGHTSADRSYNDAGLPCGQQYAKRPGESVDEICGAELKISQPSPETTEPSVTQIAEAIGTDETPIGGDVDIVSTEPPGIASTATPEFVGAFAGVDEIRARTRRVLELLAVVEVGARTDATRPTRAYADRILRQTFESLESRDVVGALALVDRDLAGELRVVIELAGARMRHEAEEAGR